MDSTAIEELAQEWRDQIDSYRDRHESVKDDQDSMESGSWDAARERAEPEIRARVLENCLERMNDCSKTDEYLEAIADWRGEVEDRDKRILDRTEWFRKSIEKGEFETRISDLEATLPEDTIPECGRCGWNKVAVADKRHKEGYRWECPEC